MVSGRKKKPHSIAIIEVRLLSRNDEGEAEWIGTFRYEGQGITIEAALEALADQNIPFTVKGKATYEQQVATIRDTASSAAEQNVRSGSFVF